MNFFSSLILFCNLNEDSIFLNSKPLKLMKDGFLVTGPAGSGKTTCCIEILKLKSYKKKGFKIINLDPSNNFWSNIDSIDIRTLIKLEDVMNELSLGPNGALIFCMEYLVDNINWLDDQINSCNQKIIFFDLPGQIELFSHQSFIKDLTSHLILSCGLKITILYFLDSQFIGDTSKFLGGSLTGLCCMLSSECPHYNYLTKIDLLKNLPSKILQRYYFPNTETLSRDLLNLTNQSFKRLNMSILQLLEDFSMLYYDSIDSTSNASLNEFLTSIFTYHN